MDSVGKKYGDRGDPIARRQPCNPLHRGAVLSPKDFSLSFAKVTLEACVWILTEEI